MSKPLKLPIGLQDFNEVIGGGYLYVDKTPYIHRLLTSGKYYFLSRPRRFGKSLTLSTIKYQAVPILFQTGYLTIKAKQGMGIYTLDYPNTEVREALLEYIISDLRHTSAVS